MYELPVQKWWPVTEQKPEDQHHSASADDHHRTADDWPGQSGHPAELCTWQCAPKNCRVVHMATPMCWWKGELPGPSRGVLPLTQDCSTFFHRAADRRGDSWGVGWVRKAAQIVFHTLYRHVLHPRAQHDVAWGSMDVQRIYRSRCMRTASSVFRGGVHQPHGHSAAPECWTQCHTCGTDVAFERWTPYPWFEVFVCHMREWWGWAGNDVASASAGSRISSRKCYNSGTAAVPFRQRKTRSFHQPIHQTLNHPQQQCSRPHEDAFACVAWAKTSVQSACCRQDRSKHERRCVWPCGYWGDVTWQTDAHRHNTCMVCHRGEIENVALNHTAANTIIIYYHFQFFKLAYLFES